MNWDWIVSIVIMLGLVLGFWAKITRQTLGELIAGIVEAVKGKTEDSTDYVQETMIYD